MKEIHNSKSSKNCWYKDIFRAEYMSTSSLLAYQIIISFVANGFDRDFQLNVPIWFKSTEGYWLST